MKKVRAAALSLLLAALLAPASLGGVMEVDMYGPQPTPTPAAPAPTPSPEESGASDHPLAAALALVEAVLGLF